MANEPPYGQMLEAIDQHDERAARTIHSRFPDLLSQRGDSLLSFASRNDDAKAIAILVDLGVDVNTPVSPPDPEGAVSSAASEGAINAVRWLLEHGATINHDYDGDEYCWPLLHAVMNGHLEVVKLLVEHGAAINGGSDEENALRFASGNKEVTDYLLSKGAKYRGRNDVAKSQGAADPILGHVEKTLGKPEPLSLQEIVPGDPPISIHVVRLKDMLTLVTNGMSSRAMKVPRGNKQYQYAELAINLPLDWPLTAKSLKSAKNYWPIEWLRRIARYPFENDTWLGGDSVVFANGEPPEPLGPGTKQTCILAAAEESEFGTLQLAAGKIVNFYTLFPLYTEERDLEKAEGVAHLMKLFEKRKISTVIDISRPNVALPPEKPKKK